ncbi:MAG: cobyric acid synthase [Planctomycetes bacterium]|nr:cobyric acid synthase [Planctomycetota bacterium]
MPAIMIQGTASGVGKSTLVAALCRIFRQDGLRVAPFKAQNMANNAHVCRDGGEIGRSTAVQAAACGIEATVDMNPVLLKPSTDTAAQVVVLGRPVKNMTAREYQDFKPTLLSMIRGCLFRLQRDYDAVVIEGAGSPAEVNLRESDIVNMRTAEIADAPVLLVGDIDVGGVFAQIVGTMQLLLDPERARVRGFIINKFRGDLEILRPGLDFLERETGRPVLGVVPHFRHIRIPEEDAVPPERVGGVAPADKIRIDVVLHPRMSNFTDFDALEAEPDVRLRYLERSDDRVPDALILPGTKSTIADLRRLKEAGFAAHVARCLERGATVVGICGGFQMLGTLIRDPRRIEAASEAEPGLGLLPSVTVFEEEKITAQVSGVHLASGAEVRGYEIHMGRAESTAAAPLLRITQRGGRPVSEFDGAEAAGGRVWGTYLHGVFDNAGFRRHFVDGLRAARGWPALRMSSDVDADAEFDKLAAHVRAPLNMDFIHRVLKGKHP